MTNRAFRTSRNDEGLCFPGDRSPEQLDPGSSS
jgi:hypothetical protein